jgi:SAM-dependent methyltransferase
VSYSYSSSYSSSGSSLCTSLNRGGEIDEEDQSIFENLSNADSNGVTDMVTQVYKIIRQATKDMRPGVTGDGIYGELTQGLMAKVIQNLQTHTDLNASSHFLDIGLGLGKPNFHVAQEVGCVSIGIEAEPIRYFLGLQNLIHVINFAESNKRFKSCCNFICGDIVNYFSFNPFTHVYIFSDG